jgi:hypothetical protein
MSKLIHPIAGAIALFMIATFWASTLVSELSGSDEMIVAVKSLIPFGFMILIPAMMAVGGTGFALAKKRRGRLVEAKRKRMPFIAANGVLILIPSALYLAAKAQAGEFDGAFYAVQAVELVAGAVNMTLLGLNMRDGLRLASGRRGQSVQAQHFASRKCH